jgi:hypothetical protein
MSQPHGRYAGSKDNRQRQSRHLSTPPPGQQRKPYVKAPPVRDPAQNASILKTRSFKLLVDAVGAENIALALESNLQRVAELVSGERFTPETAFHMETTLGLPDGFFDQPNPVLTPETITRLRSPLDVIHANAEPEGFEPFEPAVSSQAAHSPAHSPSISDRLPEELDMPKKATGGSPRAVKSNIPTTTVQSGARAVRNAAPAKVKTSAKSSEQSLPLADSSVVEDNRRANLRVLTSRKGAKLRLGTLMELSGSNIAHRLHGQKRMNDAEASRFTERLGLPSGWLDVPRSATDIPDSVSNLLLPVSLGQAPAQPQPLPVAVTSKKTAMEQTIARVRATRPRPGAVPVNVASPNGAVSENKAVTAPRQDPVRDSSAELAIHSLAENHGSVIGMREEPARAVAPPASASRPYISATPFDNLQGIEPIAEALIKTLAGKARTGRLDELKALKLLQQAVLL